MPYVKTELNKIVGNNIKAFRLQKDWTLRFFAALLNISIPGISKIENGLTDVNFSRLEQIAKSQNIAKQLGLSEIQTNRLTAIFKQSSDNLYGLSPLCRVMLLNLL